MFEDIEKEAIRQEAQALLRRFSEKLSKVNINGKYQETEGNGMRGNEKIKVADGDFRERMFANAKNKDRDFIIAEKKKW